MTTSSLAGPATRTWGIGAVAACAWLYALGVLAQVFAIGMVLLAGQGNWLANHVIIGHSIGILTMLLPILTLLARLSRSFFFATIALFFLHGLQYVFVHTVGNDSFLRAFHAVNAPLLFVLALYLGSHAYRRISRSE